MAASPKPPSTKRRTTKRKTPTTTTITTLSPLISAITTALSSSHSFLHDNDLHLLPSQSLSLQSSLSSAFLSLSKLQPHLQLPLSLSSCCWFQRLLLSSTCDDDPRWVDFFRMSKPTFYRLNSMLSDSISSVLTLSISSDFALGAAIYRLAHNGSFSIVGKRFGLSSNDACRVFYAVCKVICDQLGGYLGGFRSELGRILVGFERISLINCCGVLGVEKFPIEGDILGKDGFLMVQALVDCDGRFLDVSAGWPSTFDPDSILRQTRLFLSVEESKELLNGPEVELIDGNLMPQYILGDSCYTCLPWLLTPFVQKGEAEDSSSSEKEFNEVHKRAIELVRMAFGRVRANWKLLNRRWKEEFVEFLPFIVITACVLNNFLMKHGELSSDDDSGCVREQDMPVYDREVDEGAARIRDLLALHLSLVKFGMPQSNTDPQNARD
ncbi:protein ALP1-like isoform X2 [Chenopodium quinoa]|uniref:protein ALP1-like isoform X2 n=1 Tax=Chenopodium quinoa TaxID=63459 RepID=UPI000B77FF6B|nr:protein ALP1-like isoform X2 [Chenopodium quinoa]